MYQLENNVAWTTDLKNAFKHNVTRATIVHGNETITESNYLKNLELKECRYVPGAGFIGQAVARMITINLIDKDKNINLENEEIEVKIGADYNNNTYYINYGKFIVNPSPENDQTTDTMKIIAYDYMVKFNQNYQDRVQYPCSLRTLLIDVCSQAGVELGSEHFTNENFVVENNQFERKTLREVLQNIAKCAFSWARIGQDNKLYLDFEVRTQVDEQLSVKDYKQEGYKRANEYFGAINVVTYGDSDIQGQEESKSDMEDILLHGEKELVINDNYFAYTNSKRRELIQGGTHLWGLQYMPIQQLEMIGLIYLESNDIIEVEDLDGNTITSYVFSHIIEYNGITSDKIKNESESNNEQTYENKNTEVSKNFRLEIMADRANKKIQSIVSEIGDRSQKQTTITQDIDGINSKVEDLEDLTDTAEGITQLTLENCIEGELLELHIYGNNTVFDYLLPANDLYPLDTLYPYGDSRIVVTDEDNNSVVYELGVLEVLRQNGSIKDEFILEDNNAKVIRRINQDGTIKTNEVTENLGEIYVHLKDGTNVIQIQNYNAQIKAKFALKNTYTDIFTTKFEMESSIQQTADEINLEVSKKADTTEVDSKISQTADEINSEVRKKVGEDEVISKINQSAEQVSIQANKISLNGKELDLTGDNMTIRSTNFNVDKNGNASFTGSISISNNDLSISSSGIETKLLRIKGDTYFQQNSNIQGNNSNLNGFAWIGASNGFIGGLTVDTLSYSSLESKKTDFERLKNALDIINKTEIYKYHFKQEEKNDKKHIGFVIGDNYKYSEELTSKNNDGVELYSFISVCCKAIQEQQEQIEELKNKIKEVEENYVRKN